MHASFLRWRRSGPRLAAALAAACAGLTAAASPPAPVAPAASAPADPLDASAAVPPLRHSSAFERYRRLGDTPVAPWREVNDTAARIGGWRAYAREANVPEGAASAPAGPAAPAAPVAPASAPAAPGGRR